MEKINLVIEGGVVEINYPTDDRGRYQIVWDKIPLGYMYVTELDEDLGTPVWVATTPHVKLYLTELLSLLNLQTCKRLESYPLL